MIDNELQVRLLHAAKTQDQWKAVTSYPKKGEVCLEAINTSGATAFKIKIGDGTRPYCRNTGTTQDPDWDFTSEYVLPYFGNVISASGDLQVAGYYTYPNDYETASLRNVTVIRFYQLSLTTTAGETTLSIDSNNYKEVRAGNKLNITHTDGADYGNINHDVITTVISDNSSVVGEKDSDVITSLTTDGYGHITAYSKDKSSNMLAADLKGAVEQTDADKTWRYRVTGDTISIKEDTASLNKLDGNTIVWNQLVQNGNFGDTSTWTRYGNGISFEIANNKCTCTCIDDTKGADASSITQRIAKIQGHKYIITFKFETDTTLTPQFEWVGNPAYGVSNLTSLGGGMYGIILTSENTGEASSILFKPNGTRTNGDAWSWSNINVIDLTLMFDSAIADSMTVEAFEKLFPLPYYNYDSGSLLNVNVNGLKTVGFNQWDEEWEVGSIDTSTGEKTSATNRIVSKNYTPCFSDTSYFFYNDLYSEGNYLRICWYDANKTYLSNATISANKFNKIYQSPSNAKYFMFAVVNIDIFAYNNDICINISDTSRNGTYEPYWSNTTSVPITGITGISSVTNLREVIFPDGLKSAGSVKDSIEGNTAVKRVGVVDLGDLPWTYRNETTPYIDTTVSNMMAPGTSNTIKFISSKYDALPPKYSGAFIVTITDDRFICQSLNSSGSSKQLYLRDSTILSTDVNQQGKVSKLDGVMLYYELATPITYTNLQYPDGRPFILPINYRVDDLGTEEWLPEKTASAPIGYPVSTITYKSNFKDAVLDAIDKINNYSNPVQGESGNEPQTVGKVAIYDTDHSTVSSDYSVIDSDDTFDPTSDTTIPTVRAIVDYIDEEITVQEIETDDDDDSNPTGLIVTDKGNGTWNVSHQEIDTTASDYNIDDGASIESEAVVELVTGVNVDSYGHVTGKHTISSDKIIAADIKAPVKKDDNDTWNYRETGGDITIGEDTAKIPVLKGNTIVWNQLVDSSTSSVALASSNRYYTVIGDTKSIQTGAGTAVSVTGGTDMIVNLTKLFGSDFNIEKALLGLTTEVAWNNLTADQLALAATNFEKLFPNSYYPYCEGRLVNLGGYGVKWNQYYISPEVYSNSSNVSRTDNDNYYTFAKLQDGYSFISLAYDQIHGNAPIVGHKVFFKIKYRASDSFVWTTMSGVGGVTSISIQATVGSDWNYASAVLDVDGNGAGFRTASGTTATIDIWKNACMTIDLTEMFGLGSEPTLEEFEAMFPEDYYEFNAGTKMNIFDAIGDKKLELVSTGFNQWDEEWEVGGLSTTNGALLPLTDRIRGKDFIRIFPSTYYCFTGSSIVVCWYDNNKDFISYTNPIQTDSVRRSPANACYLRLALTSAYGTTYNNDICINISDPSRNGTYKPYKKDTLDLDWIREIEYTPSGSSTPEKLFPYGLLSAGSVHDEVTETKAIKRVGVVDLGSLDWDHTDVNLRFTTNDLIDTIKLGSRIAQLLCIKYQAIENGESYNSEWNKVIYSVSGTVLVYDSSFSSSATGDEFKAAMNGVILYYELKTPIEIPLAETHRMSYLVDDHGTEQQLPINISSVINAPFVGTFEYISNFKDTVIDLINRVNAYKNPVRGVSDTDQTVGKFAIYDSKSSTASSEYFSDTTATITSGDTVHRLPTVQQMIDYVIGSQASALQYKGTVSSYDGTNSVESKVTQDIQSGWLYFIDTQFILDEDEDYLPAGTYNIGDFIVWNAPNNSFDVITGVHNITNPNTLLSFTETSGDTAGSGHTQTIATIDGVDVTVRTPDLNVSAPSASGNVTDLGVITSVSQTGGKISANKATIPDASTSQKGVVELTSGIESAASTSTNVPTDYNVQQALELRDTGVGNLTSHTVSSNTYYTGTLQKRYDNSGTWTTQPFYPDIKLNISGYPDLQAIEDLSATSGFLKKTAANNWTLTDDTGKMKWLNETPSSGTYSYTTEPTDNEELGSFIHNYAGVTTVEVAKLGTSPNITNEGFRINIPLFTVNSATSGKVLMGNYPSLPSWQNISMENISEILSQTAGNEGYLRRTATNSGTEQEPNWTYGWELDPYGGGSLKPSYADNTAVEASEDRQTAPSAPNAGLREQTGASSYKHYKVPFSAIENDPSTGNDAVVIILNGNFS